MDSAAAAIVEALKSVFPAKRPGAFVPMVNSLQGDEPAAVAADFSDKEDWTELSPDWLDGVPDGLGSALHFLSDAAIRFYIPAYLAADLFGGLRSVDPSFSLVHGFEAFYRGTRVWPRRELIAVDGEQGDYLDIFPMHDFLRRRVHQQRNSRLASQA